MTRSRILIPALLLGAGLFFTCSAAEAHGRYYHGYHNAHFYAPVCSPIVTAPCVSAPCAAPIVQAPCAAPVVQTYCAPAYVHGWHYGWRRR